MIKTVTFEKTTYAPLPSRLEAGTPNIAGGVGLGVALEYLMSFDLERVARFEAGLVRQLEEGLRAIEGVRVLASPKERASAVSFGVEGAHPQDIGILLDNYGVAVRVGHHCAQPVLHKLGVEATVRASVGLYTTPEDIDQLLHALPKVIEMLC